VLKAAPLTTHEPFAAAVANEVPPATRLSDNAAINIARAFVFLLVILLIPCIHSVAMPTISIEKLWPT
jgi:hypothetical protein